MGTALWILFGIIAIAFGFLYGRERRRRQRFQRRLLEQAREQEHQLKIRSDELALLKRQLTGQSTELLAQSEQLAAQATAHNQAEAAQVQSHQQALVEQAEQLREQANRQLSQQLGQQQSQFDQQQGTLQARCGDLEQQLIAVQIQLDQQAQQASEMQTRFKAQVDQERADCRDLEEQLTQSHQWQRELEEEVEALQAQLKSERETHQQNIKALSVELTAAPIDGQSYDDIDISKADASATNASGDTDVGRPAGAQSKSSGITEAEVYRRSPNLDFVRRSIRTVVSQKSDTLEGLLKALQDLSDGTMTRNRGSDFHYKLTRVQATKGEWMECRPLNLRKLRIYFHRCRDQERYQVLVGLKREQSQDINYLKTVHCC